MEYILWITLGISFLYYTTLIIAGLIQGVNIVYFQQKKRENQKILSNKNTKHDLTTI